MSANIPTIVLGGSGYVAGELLRLIAAHPALQLAGILSDSHPGERVATTFTHLAPAYPDTRFVSLDDIEDLLAMHARSAVFAAAPHGVSAALIDRLLTRAEMAGARPTFVDVSADYRFRDATCYAAAYGQQHGAPHRLDQFTCAVPELLDHVPTRHVAHPGCFSTAILLAAVPLLAAGITQHRFFVTGVTGSTGSGHRPSEGTHHPRRHSDLYAYKALAHRHAPEVQMLARAATGADARIAFVPHSGPFARGIHVTVQAELAGPATSKQLQDIFIRHYAHCPFVTADIRPPRLKDVVGSNHARLFVTTDQCSVAVTVVLDNLTKGAAGGAMQWMNRLLGLPETAGLGATPVGWT